MNDWAAVVLAAGEGKRMRSRRPKVMHSLAGQPMITYPIDTLRQLGIPRIVTVVGRGAAEVKGLLGDAGDIAYAEQAERLGTGHAVLQARAAVGEAKQILVLNGDVPLIRPETLRRMIAHHLHWRVDLTILTARVNNAGDLGRVIRDGNGLPFRIVEAADRGTDDGAAEVNIGVYCFRSDWLWPRLAALPRHSNGEYYLTDLVNVAASDEGRRVEVWPLHDPDEGLGINDRAQLAHAEAVIRERVRRRLLAEGVTLVDPATTYIDAGVEIGMDTIIHPNTYIHGRTRIGEECVIGPGSIIVDSVIGHNCRVTASMLEEATLEDDVDIGPFSHLRPGAYICSGVHIGNFAEVKNSRLGRGTAMGHFSYIGDAQVGDNVNIGAGTITCNFDGVRKNRTIIGDRAFIGSDTMLVAPVEVGDEASTGAGSVVTKNVPAQTLVAGVPARPIRRITSSRKEE